MKEWFYMPDSAKFEDWFEKAKIDLNGARILFEHEADYTLVAFHCQQAIEKAFKGYLFVEKKRYIV